MTHAADADLVLYNGRITTMDSQAPAASAVAVRDGRFIEVGDDAAVLRRAGADARRIDLRGRTAIPGLIDSHLHLIRGGLTYNSELRWDGVASLGEALRRLREQALRTPPPQWVRVVGGWSEFQFAERRMPTLDELNAAAPDTPVFVLHLYAQALLNRAALRAVGYTRDTPDPPGGVIVRDRHGEPTGLLVAKPNAWILYATLAKGPRLALDDQRNSTRQFMRELNRLGVTGAIDAGGGFQQYPEHYQIIEELAAARQLTVRVAYNLFTQRPGQELEDFTRWSSSLTPGAGDGYYRLNGAGEMLVYSAADFEDFLEPRPDLPPHMEDQLGAVVEHLVARRWPFRLHATYDESIARMLDVFEAVDRKVPFQGLRWFFDHAETVSPRNIDRIAALGGGVAIQHRMAYQGEHFMRRYGPQAAAEAPPVRRMLAAGIPVGGGTDATRVASYNPWVGLGWLVSGRSVGGTELLGPSGRLSREQALRLYTAGNGWFSGEDGERGRIAPGCFADLAVLSADYFAVPEAEIRGITSELTVVGGDVVHASGDFGGLAPPPLPFSPDWAPPAHHGGYDPGAVARALHRAHRHHHHHAAGLACPCAVF
ncbi:amidohydrolase [Nannocystis bainbridge]|uniref:Amidohydrolase n=1 Tax=Nannocystis bainbridge TaxID=2995303 RepID=A0ABT5E3B8_9BACT|nr:amidohydrolase [Nannocystis bainbridge]MDC0720364.1 amidohydrolase [Nannocystis bainbridge]